MPWPQPATPSFSITRQEPTAAGTFPVFVYMVGTTETLSNKGAAAAAVSGMVRCGFAATSIQYDRGEFGNCPQLSIGSPASPSTDRPVGHPQIAFA